MVNMIRYVLWHLRRRRQRRWELGLGRGRRVRREVYDTLGWLLCEAAFRCDMRLGTGRLYDLGCWFYDRTKETR